MASPVTAESTHSKYRKHSRFQVHSTWKALPATVPLAPFSAMATLHP
jgi:hypothetical protein